MNSSEFLNVEVKVWRSGGDILGLVKRFLSLLLTHNAMGDECDRTFALRL